MCCVDAAATNRIRNGRIRNEGTREILCFCFFLLMCFRYSLDAGSKD